MTSDSISTTDIQQPMPEARAWQVSLFAHFAAVMVILLMLWPVLHRYLVVEYGMNPWKGFGVAMYCTAVPSKLEILIPTSSGFHTVPVNQSSPEWLKNEYENYLNKRHTLGYFAGPPSRRFVDQMFLLDDKLTNVLFRSEALWLNPRSNKLELRNRVTYHYRKLEGQVVLYDFLSRQGEDPMKYIDF